MGAAPRGRTTDEPCLQRRDRSQTVRRRMVARCMRRRRKHGFSRSRAREPVQAESRAQTARPGRPDHVRIASGVSVGSMVARAMRPAPYARASRGPASARRTATPRSARARASPRHGPARCPGLILSRDAAGARPVCGRSSSRPDAPRASPVRWHRHATCHCRLIGPGEGGPRHPDPVTADRRFDPCNGFRTADAGRHGLSPRLPIRVAGFTAR